MISVCRNLFCAIAFWALCAGASFAGYDLKLECKAENAPSTIALATEKLSVEIDPIFRRAKISDAVLLSYLDGPRFVEDVDVRKSKVRFGFNHEVPREIVARDGALHYAYYTRIFFDFSYSPASRKFRYTYGIRNFLRSVTLKGTCNEV